jgi:hypothetical protein
MAEPEPTFSQQFAHPDRRKVAAVAGACVAVIITAAVVMGASPTPSPTSGAGASAAPGASAKPHAEGSARPDRGVFKFKLKGGILPFAFGGPAFGMGLGRGGVEITAIDGSSVALKTVDGWTRTIEVTSSTQITKGGDTIALTDLAVGDTIRFRQQRNADGSFSVTRIDVVLPSVAGTVTSKTGSTITLKQRDGTSVTVHVNGSTKFRVQGVTGTASLSDVAIGMGLIANGEKNADGSLNADRVLAGSAKKLRDGAKPGNPHDNSGQPDASPEGSETPG